MKIRYALIAAVAALFNLVGNAAFILNSEVQTITLVVSAGGGASLGLSKWFLLLFSACALGFTSAYVFLQIKRAHKAETGQKEKLEDRTVRIASLAVAVMGWVLSLVLL